MFEHAISADREIIDRLREAERQIAVLHAEQLDMITEMYRRARDWISAPADTPGLVDAAEVAAAEIGVALRIARRSAVDRLGLAVHVLQGLPATAAALRSGEVSLAKARIIADATADLTDQHTAEVEARVLPRAGRQTPAGLGVSVARAVLAADPDAARRRHAAAVRERTVRFTPGPDGMASLWARLTVADALGCYRELCELADSAAPPPDTAPTASEPGLPPGGGARDDRTADDRTAEARRADTLVDLIMGAATRLHPEDGAACAPVPTPARPGADNVPDDASAADTDADTEVAAAAPAALRRPPPQARDGRGRARIDVTVARTTLAGLDDQPGYLRGYGPIDADAARELAADATWRRLLTDPANDTVLDVGTTRYSPPGAMAALVQATGPDLSLVRLPPARCPLRPGPHRPVPAGSHRHPQPRRTMSRAPPAENPHPMAGRAERRRRADLDQPRRTTGQDRTLAPRPAPPPRDQHPPPRDQHPPPRDQHARPDGPPAAKQADSPGTTPPDTEAA